MRTTYALLSCLAPLMAVTPLVLNGCGGGSNSNAKLGQDGSASGGGELSSGGGSGGGSGGTSGGEDGGGGGSGSGGGSTSSGASSSGVVGDDASPPGEGGGGSSSGSSIPVPDGGAASTPGVVACGSSTCSTSSQLCCESTGGDGGAAASCVAPNGTCASGIESSCDEASDCASGSVCCELDAYGPHAATCHAGSCPAGNFQVCRTDAECGTGDGGAPQKCIVQSCPTGPGAMTTVTLEACAYPTTTGGYPGGGVPGGGMTMYGALPACTAK